MLNETLATEIKAAAAEYVQQAAVVPLPQAGYEAYLREGNRIIFEKSYFARRRQLVVLSLAYQLEPKPAIKELLEQVIWEVCNEYTWALPAHLPIVAGEFAPSSRTCIDLFAAETGQALSEIHQALGDELTPFLQRRIEAEVEERIFQAFEAHEWAWEYKENNWSAVIGGSVGLAALALLPQGSPRQKRIIQRLETTMASYLAGFGDDGACVEGVGYWGYGFGYFIYYAEKLARVLGDDHYLELPKVKNIAAFPYYAQISERDYLPFSDYSPAELPSGLVSFCYRKLAVKVPNVTEVSPLDFDHCYRYAHLSRNIAWTTAAITLPANQPIVHYFADAQWYVFRSPGNQLIFAAKGGRNDESHNQNDLGNFILGDSRRLYLDDLGAGEYTRDYFNEEKRYDYFVNSALSHNVPIINGYLQQAGDYFADQVIFDPENPEQISFELTSAYPEAAGLQRYIRTFELVPDQKQLTIRDEFNFQQGENQVVENFVTKLSPKLAGENVSLTAEANYQLHTAGSVFTCQKQCYSAHDGNQEACYLLQGEVLVGDKQTITTTITF